MLHFRFSLADPCLGLLLLQSLVLLLLLTSAPLLSNAAPNKTAAAAVAVQCVRQIDSCRCETSTGRRIDLSPLAKSGGGYGIANRPGPKGNFLYSFNPCNGATCNGMSDAATCQKAATGAPEYILGTQSSAKFGSDQTLGLLLRYSAVSSDKIQRDTQIQLVCDTSGGGVSLLTPLDDGTGTSPPYLYKMSLLSGYCCETDIRPDETGGGLSGGDILLITLFSLIFLYIAIGLAVNMLGLKRRGRDAVPNVTFWIALPGLVRDGAVFTFVTVRAKATGKSRGEYQSV